MPNEISGYHHANLEWLLEWLLALKETRGINTQYSEPYRLYNTHISGYELGSPVTLYGDIPFMQAHRKDSYVGLFWLHAAETWIDITKTKTKTDTNTNTRWISEAGHPRRLDL